MPPGRLAFPWRHAWRPVQRNHEAQTRVRWLNMLTERRKSAPALTLALTLLWALNRKVPASGADPPGAAPRSRGPMPTLFRLLIVLAIIGLLIGAAMSALAILVTPTPREITTTITLPAPVK